MAHELPLLCNIDCNFFATGVSGVDTSSNILIGRPYGGVAILWRSNLNNYISVIQCNDPRICGINLDFDGHSLAFFCIYLPTESEYNLLSFIDYLAKIKALVHSAQTSSVAVIGDFNCKPTSELFYTELQRFCHDNSLILSDITCLPKHSYTYVSDSHNSVSWLDHCMSTVDMHQSLSSFEIVYDNVASDHRPMSFNLNCTGIPLQSQKSQCTTDTSSKVPWEKFTEMDRLKYHDTVCQKILKLHINNSCIACYNTSCSNPAHLEYIQDMSTSIIDILSSSACTVSSAPKPNYNIVPGWNDQVKSLYSESRESFLLWNSYDKPKHGPVFDLMRRSRSRFKLALRTCRKQEKILRADAMVNASNPSEFWKLAKSVDNYSVPLPDKVGDAVGDEQITSMWKTHYSDLLNAVNNSKLEHSVRSSVSHVPFETSIICTFTEIEDIVHDTPKGKSPGLDHISIEHLLYAPRRVLVLLSLLFTCMFTHGIIPSLIMNVALIPILKNKLGSIKDVGNYRPIAIASILSKIFERLILRRCEIYIYTSAHQFGFKKYLSTDLCILLLKETVRHYISSGSPVSLCFLDASKAFDRVNHWRLFDKLIMRRVPLFLVRILMFWYTSQCFCVKWGNCFSSFFCSTNGVRQGGILSPFLFNVYMDDLSTQLCKTKKGCYMSNVCFNHLMYADDIVLLSPSIAGMRSLLDECSSYAKEHDIIFNQTKTVSMNILPNRQIFKDFKLPPIFLDNIQLNVVHEYKYLGHTITSDLKDDIDIKSNYRSTCARSNQLIRKFPFCSDKSKISLFKSYCTSFYCSALWQDYTKSNYHKLNMLYNNSFRFLLNLPKSCSASQMFVFGATPSFQEIIRKNINSMRRRLSSSSNLLLKTYTSSTYYKSSALRTHWDNLTH